MVGTSTSPNARTPEEVTTGGTRDQNAQKAYEEATSQQANQINSSLSIRTDFGTRDLAGVENGVEQSAEAKRIIDSMDIAGDLKAALKSKVASEIMHNSKGTAGAIENRPEREQRQERQSDTVISEEDLEKLAQQVIEAARQKSQGIQVGPQVGELLPPLQNRTTAEAIQLQARISPQYDVVRDGLVGFEFPKLLDLGAERQSLSNSLATKYSLS